MIEVGLVYICIKYISCRSRIMSKSVNCIPTATIVIGSMDMNDEYTFSTGKLVVRAIAMEDRSSLQRGPKI